VDQEKAARRSYLIPLLSLLVGSAWAPGSLPAQDLIDPTDQMAPIEYTLRFPAPHTHYVEVQAAYPATGDSLDLMMAVWTPGSYLVRDYSGKVESVRVLNEGAAIAKTDKNRWRVQAPGDESIRIAYRVYSREMSVRNNWVESDFAILVGAATFITAVDPATDAPAEAAHRVRVELPAGWAESHAALPVEGGAYVAEDFDELLDSPILAGDLAVDRFNAAGAPHALAHVGDYSLVDRERAVEDVRKLVEQHVEFWGVRPYERYSFLNAITESGGGLEHKNSTLLMAKRWFMRSEKSYKGWLKLVSHEFFHTWNVKRLRPRALGPFDYEREIRTESLWIAEGFTSYYEALLMRRAGLIDDAEFLDYLSDDVKAVQTTPGRLVDPVTEASKDAWVKAYKRHEATTNQTVSYYSKGAAIAWLLDARIRAATRGEKSLDDALRAAYASYSGEHGYTPEEFQAVLSETAGEDLSTFLDEALNQANELDYAPALDWWGLRFKTKEADPDDGPPAWLGASFDEREGRVWVSQAKTGTPAHEAGLNVGDELLAIDGYRVPAGELEERLTKYRPGAELTLLLSRREKILELPLTAGQAPAETWELEVDPEAGKKAQKRLRAWLGE